LTSSRLPKGPKTPKKCHLYHFFSTQEVVLGDFIFGWVNGLKIKKIKLSQKVDSPIFPMSYYKPNLEFWKPSKTCLEKATRIGSVARRIGEKFAILPVSSKFHPVCYQFDFLFSLGQLMM